MKITSEISETEHKHIKKKIKIKVVLFKDQQNWQAAIVRKNTILKIIIL